MCTLRGKSAPVCPPETIRSRAALDINSFTPVRMLADRVGTTEVLQHQRSISHVCRVRFASTPHTCWLNCDSSDTVDLTPQICKGNHDEPCYVTQVVP